MMAGNALWFWFCCVLLCLAAGVGSNRPQESDSEAQCCSRKSKIISVGKDAASGDVIEVDVGECENQCHRNHHHHHQPRIKRERFQQLLRENSHLSPEEVYRKAQRRLRRACRRHQTCAVSASSIVSYATQEALLNISVTEACACQPDVTQCVRQTHWVTFHEGTPLQTSVDVGTCDGPCSAAGDGCKPTHSRTMTVAGPNGAECVAVVEECSCVGACYRTTRLQQVYNHTADSGGWAGPHIRKIEVVDVGECVGGCDASDTQRHCVYQSSTGDCLMSLEHSPKTCTATRRKRRFYHSHDGLLKSLKLVKECKCS